MASSDVDFTFDNSDFIKGMKENTNALNNFSGNMKKSTSNISSGAKGMTSSFGDLGKKLLVVGAAFFSIKAIVSKIPEIGQAFSIAGDIFMRNFLEPLRRFLIPLLMQMITWVRKNRTAFVKMGQIFANVFRVIIVIIKQVIGFMKIMIKSAGSFLEGVFGKTVKNIGNLINVLIFKIAVILIFLAEALKPVFKVIGKIIGFLIVSTVKFLKGFFKGFKPVFKIFGSIIKMVVDFVKWLFKGSKVGKFLFQVFEDIGQIVGSVFVVTFERIKATLSIIINFVKGVIQGLSGGGLNIVKIWETIKNVLLGITGAMADVFRWVGKTLGPAARKLGKIIGSTIGAAFKLISFVVKGIVSFIKTIGKFLGKTIGKVVGLVSKIAGLGKSAIKFIFGGGETEKEKAEKIRLQKRIDLLKKQSGVPSGGFTANTLITGGGSGSGSIGNSNNTAKNTITLGDINIAVNGAQDSSSVVSEMKDKLESMITGIFNDLLIQSASTGA